MSRNFLRNLLAFILAAAVAVALPGCALRSLVNAVAEGVLPSDDGHLTNEPTPAPAASTPVQPSAGGAPQPELPPVEAGDRELVPFPEMVYVRPNVESMAAELREIAAQVRDADDTDAVISAMSRAEDILDAFYTASTLAMIHSSMDFSDQHWASEYTYCSAGTTAVQEAASSVQSAIAQSPAGQEAGLGNADSLYDSPRLVELFNQENALQNQFSNLLGTLTVNTSEGELTYAEVSGSQYTAWLAQNGPVLGNIYVELLKVRYQIAQETGYSNYLEFLFDINETEYTPDMLDQLLNRIAATITPLYQQLERLGIYPIEEEFTEESAFAYMNEWFSNLNPQLNEALDLMRAYLLYDFSTGPNKDATPFTTYIDDYHAPFLMASFTGTYADMQDVLHEFGHFYHYTQDPDSGMLSTDLSEVFSTALPLLVTNFYPDSFGSAEGYYMLYNQLADDLGTFVYQSYFTGFELAAYQLPPEEITIENLCAISQGQWNRFGLTGDHTVQMLDWSSTAHLYESALYVASYILAEDVALQLWELSDTSVESAMAAYTQLMDGAREGLPLLQDLQQAGLVSPFAEGEIETQAAYFQRYLLDEEFVDEIFFGEEGEPAGESMESAPDTYEEDPEERYGTFFGFSDGEYSYRFERPRGLRAAA